MIVITLAGTAYMFTSGMLTSKTAKTINLLNFVNNMIVLQNTGTDSISINNDLKIVVNGEDVTKLTSGTINPQSSAAIKFIPPRFGEKLTTANVQVVGPSNTVAFKTNIVPHDSKITADTVALWRFDEGSEQTAYDETDNNNDGGLQGDASWATGRYGSAVTFDGDLDYVSIPTSTSLKPNTLTVSAWVYLKSGGNNHFDSVVYNKGWTVFACGFENDAAPVQIFGVRFTDQPGRYEWTYRTGNKEASLDAWHHVAYVYDGSTMKMYMDGEETDSYDRVGTIDWDGSVHGDPEARIGGNNFGGYSFSITDEVHILSRALSQEELVDSVYS